MFMYFVAITVTLSVICSVLLLIFEKKGNAVGKFVLKTLASLFFVTSGFIALYSSENIDKIYIFIVEALVLSMLGDIFLCIEDISKDTNIKLMELIGMSFFLIAHIAYFLAFVFLAESFNYWLLIIVVALPLVILLLDRFKLLKLQILKIPAAVYAAVIGAMLSGAINLLTVNLSIGSIIIIIAAIIFVISDILLTFYNYGKGKHFVLKIGCIVPYYLSQCLLALSILFG